MNVFVTPLWDFPYLWWCWLFWRTAGWEWICRQAQFTEKDTRVSTWNNLGCFPIFKRLERKWSGKRWKKLLSETNIYQCCPSTFTGIGRETFERVRFRIELVVLMNNSFSISGCILHMFNPLTKKNKLGLIQESPIPQQLCAPNQFLCKDHPSPKCALKKWRAYRAKIRSSWTRSSSE